MRRRWAPPPPPRRARRRRSRPTARLAVARAKNGLSAAVIHSASAGRVPAGPLHRGSLPSRKRRPGHLVQLGDCNLPARPRLARRCRRQDVGEERRVLPELVARPFGEGVVVALGALEVDPEEQSRGAAGQVLRLRLVGRQEHGSRPRPARTLRDEVADEPVVADVRPEAVLQPLLELRLGERARLVGPAPAARPARRWRSGRGRRLGTTGRPGRPRGRARPTAVVCSAGRRRGNRGASVTDGIRPARSRWTRRKNSASSAPGAGFTPCPQAFSTSASIRPASDRTSLSAACSEGARARGSTISPSKQPLCMETAPLGDGVASLLSPKR